MKAKRYTLYTGLICLGLALIACILGSAAVGAAGIPPLITSKVILSHLPFIGPTIDLNGIDSGTILIIMKIRLPRILLAASVGVALASSGAVFQGIFKNPMADPYVLGVSSGAAMGATIIILTGINGTLLGFSFLTIGAFIGALLTAFTVFSIARAGQKTPVVTLLLAGIAVNFFLSALISTAMAISKDKMENIIFWTMGSVSTANWNKLLIVLMPIAVIMTLLMTVTRDLNAMAMGEENAKSLGVEVEGLKLKLLILASIMTAAAVSVSGIIGFVGLVVPHVVRMISGPDHRTLLPFSALGGAIFMVITDTGARMLVAPAEMPLGVITSLLGAPYFLLLLYQSKKHLQGRSS